MDTRFLLQLTTCGIVKRFLRINKTAGQRPLVLERFFSTLNEHDFQFILVQPENHAIDSDRVHRVFI